MSTPERIGTIREAINEALHEEMQRDPAIILMGEDVGLAGACSRSPMVCSLPLGQSGFSTHLSPKPASWGWP